MNCTYSVDELQERITREIIDEQNQEMAKLIARKRREAATAEENYRQGIKAIEEAGLKVGHLDTLERELTARAEKELEVIKAQMDAESQERLPAAAQIEVEGTFLPQGAQLIRPTWVAAFADDDVQDKLTEAAAITSQTLLTGGSCKNYHNWAKGAGSGLFGTGVGEIQSWVHFGFWFKPPTTRFYSIQPLFR
ncbi:hypothetical protein, partial [Aquisalimonas sp.]|uniref:hypothetical protein n=1 Tax=Aquisalimonas sp. TaxID=1872621 RepID=UPI0025B7F4CA